MHKYNIELFPDSTNCIETVARKEYNSLTDKLLKIGRYDNVSEVKFELLRMFLESFDFRKLRRESEKYLVKGQQIKFVIYQERGRIKYRIVSK